MKTLDINSIKKMLDSADETEFAALERSLVADTRKGVQASLRKNRSRLDKQAQEAKRIIEMYAFERSLLKENGCSVAVGLDEVGRGPLAGPLAVGAVVLPKDCAPIDGINDSKQLSPEKRIELDIAIRSAAIATSVKFISPKRIDEVGMTRSLTDGFKDALEEIEQQCSGIDLILLDGNPLHLDEREINVIKGDSKCPSIAAASIIAKVARDAYMDTMAELFPAYGFDSNKGYGTNQHIKAIETHGLCEIHRQSFCTSFLQERLF